MTISRSVSWAYGLGSFMRVGENLIAFYLLFYLTTVVGLPATTAGLISGLSVLLGAVLSPVIGAISDRSNFRSGRRRPFMVIAAIPTMALLALLFTKVDFGAGTSTYYYVVAAVYIIAYYTFLVPYDALGSTLTEDPGRRAMLRAICTGALYLSVLVGGTLVLQVQAALANTIPADTAWTLAVILCCSIPGAVFGLIAWRATRGREIPDDTVVRQRLSGRSITKLLTLRPVISIFAWTVVYFFANAILAGSTIYFGLFVLGLDEATVSTLFLVSAVTTFIAVAPAAYLARRIGKRPTLLAAMALFVVVASIVAATGIHGYLTGAIISVAFGITNSVALVCSYAMIYDLREVTELRLRVDMTALTVGIFTLLIGVTSALAPIVLGSLLEAAAFDPTAAPSQAITDLLFGLQTWIPALVIAASAVALLFWNVDEKAHQRIVDELHASRQNA